MTRNNFELISSLLHFDNPDSFYFCQIIKRKKDPGNESMPRSEKVIKSYYIYSFNQFKEIRNDIIDMCELFNARAYFNLAPRSAERCTYQTLKNLTDHIIAKEWNCNGYLFDSAAGQTCEQKLWLIDVDEEDLPLFDEICDTINNLCSPTETDKIICTVPSKSGLHLITNPFNKAMFENHRFSNGKHGFDIDVHKNAPTILYVP